MDVHILVDVFLKIMKKRFKDGGQLVMEVETTYITTQEALKECHLKLVLMLYEEERL